VDDENKAIALFRKLISEFEEIEVVATAQSVDDALDAILEYHPEIIFLDIQMPNKNGFELLHEIRDFELQPTIIFVTAYDEYAIEAIRHSAFDYLTKPVDPKLLKKAIRRYQCEKARFDSRRNISLVLDHLSPNKIKFSSRSGTIFLDLDDITYIQAEGNYSEIFLSNCETHMVSMNLAKLLEKLPGSMFFRISRSMIINLKFLKKLDRRKKLCELEVNDKSIQLPIPIPYIKAVEEYLQ